MPESKISKAPVKDTDINIRTVFSKLKTILQREYFYKNIRKDCLKLGLS